MQETCFDEVYKIGEVDAGRLLNSRSVSLFSNTQSPYAPAIVPSGILIRLTAESTIPTTRDHGLKLSNPYPVTRLGNAMSPQNVASAIPAMPRTGTAIAASCGSAVAP